MAPRTKRVPMNFKHMPQVDVPQGRNGKHKQVVTQILSDLGWIRRLRRQGLRSQRAFARRPTMDSFLRQAEGFTDGVRLASPGVAAVIEAIRASGRRAAQAMFGQVVFVADPPEAGASPFPILPGTRDLGRVRVGIHGARLLKPRA